MCAWRAVSTTHPLFLNDVILYTSELRSFRIAYPLGADDPSNILETTHLHSLFLVLWVLLLLHFVLSLRLSSQLCFSISGSTNRPSDSTSHGNHPERETHSCTVSHSDLALPLPHSIDPRHSSSTPHILPARAQCASSGHATLPQRPSPLPWRLSQHQCQHKLPHHATH